MKILIVIFGLISITANAQQDTVYVQFSNNNNDYKLTPMGKHKDDQFYKKHYPFDSARIYIFPKKVGNFTKDLIFSYSNYTPGWMDNQFYYEKIDISRIREKTFYQ